MRVRDLFNKLDRDGSGYLNGRELQRLVSELMRSDAPPSDAELEYFLVSKPAGTIELIAVALFLIHASKTMNCA
jgi:Ca2+-binding EF-hand superfamily protein